MAFDVGAGNSRRPSPTMNVTPLVDVVLVLLIIFMVLTPMLTKQFWTYVPEKETSVPAPTPESAQTPVVVRVDLEQRIFVGNEEVPPNRLAESLRQVVAARKDGTVFFDAPDALPYEHAIAVMDLARAGGATTLVPLAVPLAENSR